MTSLASLVSQPAEQPLGSPDREPRWTAADLNAMKIRDFETNVYYYPDGSVAIEKEELPAPIAIECNIVEWHSNLIESSAMRIFENAAAQLAFSNLKQRVDELFAGHPFKGE